MRKWLQISCVLIVIAGAFSKIENSIDKRSYDLNELFTNIANRLESSLRIKEFGALDRFKPRNIREEFQFQPSGYLEQNYSKCVGDIFYTFENIKSAWALKLFDSFGKPGSGILQGNVRWVGDYDECIGIRSSNSSSSSAIGNFRGKYCSVSWSPFNQTLTSQYGLGTGICIPDSCSAEEIKEDAHQLLYFAGVVPNLNATKSVSLICKPTERHLNTPAIAVITLLSVFGILTVIGSSISAFRYFKKIIEGFNNASFREDNDTYLFGDSDNPILGKDVPIDQTSQEDYLLVNTKTGFLHKLEAFFCCFCVFTNGSKILNTNTLKGELLCIHGIRFLSMSWVILGHTYVFGIAEITNILTLFDYLDTFLFQIVVQGTYSVDSFFVLSGFLVAYLTMKEFAKTNGSIAWPSFYVHRYLRLTPIYMVLLGFSATVFLYMGSGPYWPDGDVDTICRDNWWRNLLYINNFSDQTKMCMAWAWYLANDMQFFIISPLFLITLWRWPKIGLPLVGVFVVACWLSNFFITYHFDLGAGTFNLSEAPTASLLKYMDYFNKIYVKPYTRISPYLIGILTGYLLFKRKEKSSPRHDLIFVCVGWIVASTIALTCVFGLYHSKPPLIGNSFYNALHRTGFALGLCWVIYICLIGQGGFVNRILSYKLFVPLSRLTYTAYLIHPMIISGYFGSLKTPIAFAHPTIVFLFLGFIVVTYGLSLPVALMLESPIICLEKMFRKGFVRERKNDFVN